MERLTREFYTRDALTVAQELLGKVLVHRLEGRPWRVGLWKRRPTRGRRTGRPTPTLGGARPGPR